MKYANSSRPQSPVAVTGGDIQYSMVFCCAFQCNNRLSANLRLAKGITFHKFPDVNKEPDRRKRWIANLRREGFTPTKSTRICSQHFLQEMIDRSAQITRLKPEAVPTLFSFPSNLQKSAKSCLPPKKRQRSRCSKNSREEDNTCSDVSAVSGLSITEYVQSEHSYYTSLSPRKLKRQADSAAQCAEDNRKKRKH